MSLVRNPIPIILYPHESRDLMEEREAELIRPAWLIPHHITGERVDIILSGEYMMRSARIGEYSVFWLEEWRSLHSLIVRMMRDRCRDITHLLWLDKNATEDIIENTFLARFTEPWGIELIERTIGFHMLYLTLTLDSYARTPLITSSRLR